MTKLIKWHPKFIGWVPTVSGKLSFRVIGDTTFPYPSYYFNEVIHGVRYIFSIQNRYTEDNILYELSLQTKKHMREFYFIGICDLGRKNKGEFICGKCFAIKKNVKYTKFDFYKDVIATMTTNKRDNKLDCIDEEFNKIKESLKEYTDYMADVILLREGIICFKNFKSSKGLNYGESNILGNQFYFFIRDISHKHKHHNDSEDTTLTIHRYDYTSKWMYDILYSLYYLIIRYSRQVRMSRGMSGLRSHGVLAYAKSYKKIINYLYDMNLDMHNDTEMNISIQADINREMINNQNISTSNQTNLTILAISISIIFGILSGYKGIQNEYASHILQKVNSNALYYIFFLLIPLLLYFCIIFVKNWKNIVLRYKYLKNIIRVFMYDPRIYGFILLLLSAFFICTSTYFVYLFVT